jgi:hypothetical protein
MYISMRHHDRWYGTEVWKATWERPRTFIEVVLCRMLYVDFGELPFHALGTTKSHHLDNTFRNGERENITWVHIPVFLLATKTILTFCTTAVKAVMVATPSGMYSRGRR